MMQKLSLLVYLIFALTRAFEFPKLPKFGGGKLSSDQALVKASDQVQSVKTELFDVISGTNNGKTATPQQQLQAVQLTRKLETLAPSPVDILTDLEQARKIDGVWYLQYTCPSEVGDEIDKNDGAWQPENADEGESKINTKQFDAKGSVTAAGITVDTSNKLVQQIINVSDSTVLNRVDLGWGIIEAGGSFRPSEAVPNRAIVSFNKADITLENGFIIRLGFFFDIFALFKSGVRDNGWLETTYIDSDCRVGRGNKGTLFVLTRDRDQVAP